MNRIVAMLLIALVMGCKSTPKQDARFSGEINHAINRAKELLVKVDAPIHSKFPDQRFLFQEATVYGSIPCTGIKGYGFPSSKGGFTFDYTIGKSVIMPIKEAQPQPDVWMVIVMHGWLRGTESDDYMWINKAIGSCLK